MCVPQLASLKTPQEKMLENEFEKLWMSHQKEIKGEIKREFEEKLERRFILEILKKGEVITCQAFNACSLFRKFYKQSFLIKY